MGCPCCNLMSDYPSEIKCQQFHHILFYVRPYCICAGMNTYDALNPHPFHYVSVTSSINIHLCPHTCICFPVGDSLIFIDTTDVHAKKVWLITKTLSNNFNLLEQDITPGVKGH